MNFITPTTKEEMYVVLQDMYYYYRIRREGYKDADLKELNLEKLVFTSMSEEELRERAEVLLSAENQKFTHDYILAINEELRIVEDKLAVLDENKEKLITQTRATYAESQRKAELNAVKNGLAGSSIIVDKWTELETKLNERLSEIEEDFSAQEVDLISQRDNLNLRMENALSYCEEQALKKVNAKIEELKQKQDETERSVFKYNNGIEEKVQKYRNTIAEANANLMLKFLEIRGGEYSKSELVEMGYYESVINCVCSYFDTLDAMTAATQIGKENKLMIYLDDYYDTVLYMYQQRALFQNQQNQA